MVTFEVTLMKKGTFTGKKVMVSASDKSEAFKKALGMQPNAFWTPMTANVVADRMDYKFKHPGVRYST